MHEVRNGLSVYDVENGF